MHVPAKDLLLPQVPETHGEMVVSVDESGMQYFSGANNVNALRQLTWYTKSILPTLGSFCDNGTAIFLNSH